MLMTITHAGVGYVNCTAAHLAAAGVPAQAIADATAGVRRAFVKAECRRRIYGVASAETQMNMAAAATIISAKTASTRTEAEKALMAAFAASLEWVQDMRAAIETITADAAADVAADASWPPCPQEVVALAAQF